MAGDSVDDEYVARLLKQDARDASKKYGAVGMNAFHPKRSRQDAPKPNTGFLRHIIRQTDSHNAALLARETKDSRTRLRELDTASKNADERTAAHRDRPSPSHVGSGALQRQQSRREAARHTGSRRDSSNDQDGGHRRSRHAEKRERDARHSGHRRRRKHHSDEGSDGAESRQFLEDRSGKHKRRKYMSSARAPVPRRPHDSSRYGHRSRSPRSPVRQASTHGSRHATTEDESDPLEAIVGPLPPPQQPAVRSRGRGVQRSSAGGIDARFSSAYDPALDIEPALDGGDEWSDAVEAFRDRQRWKQQGAERLQAAGFSAEQVKQWGQGAEKTEEDVRWTARGQAREWDRGKVVDAEGGVGFRAAWTDGL